MQERYAIVGAGASGLAVAKNFLEAKIAFDCFEREDDVGGNWYYGKPASSVYCSTRLISSKRLTEFTDFPMPDDYPEYPGREQVWEYLRGYARHFRLYERIEFGRSVESIQKAATAGRVNAANWNVQLNDGELRQYTGIVIANGHNWDPKWPEYPGTFAGLVLHSSEYKTPDVLVNKRVLVVGAGNSGCDIAVESAQHAAVTFHSVRRGYHFLPKFLKGKPIDQLNERMLRWRLPLWLRRAIASYAVRLAIGRPQDFGLPAPDHRLFETHPIINSQLIYYLGHKQIHTKGDVVELIGDRVRFVDGSEEPIDVIVYATGYRITFPFIDQTYLNCQNGCPRLLLNVFHPTDDTLFVAGLIQPDSGQWGLVDYQARLIARYIVAKQAGRQSAERFRNRLAVENRDLAGGIRYLNSDRHLLEVEHYRYRERLKRLIRCFDG